LVLNSYLYHHQKCRAAESAFERALAREYTTTRSIVGRKNVWKLFALRDADLLLFSRGKSYPATQAADLINRRLRVQVIQFRYEDLAAQTEQASVEFNSLLDLAVPKTWNDYRRLLLIEDDIAKRAGLPKGSVVLDIPKSPSYADLENLLLPGRMAGQQESPAKVLNYRDWIAAYSAHRTFIRVFAPRGKTAEQSVCKAARDFFKSRSILLPASVEFRH